MATGRDDWSKAGLLKRLEARTNKSLGCWLWHGATQNKGYGVIGIRYKMILVHRVSAHIHWDFDLDSDIMILHKCDIPRCWNPEHLFEGNQLMNMRDAASKGRSGRYPTYKARIVHTVNEL